MARWSRFIIKKQVLHLIHYFVNIKTKAHIVTLPILITNTENLLTVIDQNNNHISFSIVLFSMNNSACQNYIIFIVIKLIIVYINTDESLISEKNWMHKIELWELVLVSFCKIWQNLQILIYSYTSHGPSTGLRSFARLESGFEIRSWKPYRGELPL